MKTDINLKTKSTKLIRVLLPLVLAGVLTSGCAQFMAIRQSVPCDPTCLKPGVNRVHVLAELGPPANTIDQTNSLVDEFKYTDGGSKNNVVWKTTRVTLYTAGDIFTFWMDQFIWMPMELNGFSGTDHSVVVRYDKAADGFWYAKTIDNKALASRVTKRDELNGNVWLRQSGPFGGN